MAALESAFMASCYYQELGVERGADAAEVKKAYRKLAMTCHPDKCVRLGLGLGLGFRV